MSAYIGIDLGTSGVKMLLTDGEGKILNETSRTYPVSRPAEGWSEQNPEDWWEAVKDGLRELACKKNLQIAGIAVAGQMHGLVALDEKNNVIRPCILWNDGRTGEQTDYLNNVVGRDKLSSFTGNIAFAGFTAPKLLWLKKHEPENFARIAKIMLPKDYITFKLTGNFSTDYSDASGTLLLDVKNKCWSKDMCAICGVTSDMLPRLYESFAPCGTVCSEACEELGLCGNIVVAAGAGDNAAAAVGTGAVAGSGCNISIGTSGTIFIPSVEFGADGNNSLHSFAHADGKYHLMGCILSAASANKWWTEDVLAADYSIAEKSADLLGTNSVYFLPYLMGERSPHNDVNARGAFIGLNAETSASDMSLAVLEGVAFAFKDCLEASTKCGIRPSYSTVCGGGARSALWIKILSNVLDMKLYTVETEQGPAYGAAMLAMVACGKYKSVAEAAKAMVKTTLAASPEDRLVNLYKQRYCAFKALYPLLKDWFLQHGKTEV